MWMLLIAFFIGYEFCDAYHIQPSIQTSSGAYYTPPRHGHYIQAPAPTTATPPQYYQPQVVHVGYPTTTAPSNQGYYQQQQQQQRQQQIQQQRYQGSPILRFENTNNGDGNYRFAYDTANGLQQEEQGYFDDRGRVVKGFYSYVGPNGKVYTVHYYADATGFHASGDHIPTSEPVNG